MGEPDRTRRADRGGSGVAVVLSAMLLSGALASVVSVSVTVARLNAERGPAIASVRLGELAAGYAVAAAESGASGEAAAAGARAWGIALEAALDRVAERSGMVLLPARAVAAGAPDVTGTVELVLREYLAGRRPGAAETER